jgi:hypothetical protein
MFSNILTFLDGLLLDLLLITIISEVYIVVT